MSDLHTTNGQHVEPIKRRDLFVEGWLAGRLARGPVKEDTLISEAVHVGILPGCIYRAADWLDLHPLWDERDEEDTDAVSPWWFLPDGTTHAIMRQLRGPDPDDGPDDGEDEGPAIPGPSAN